MNEAIPPPATFAFSWLSGLLLYGTSHDDGRAASDTWLLTHPDLRLSTALTAGVAMDHRSARELVDAGATVANEMWVRFAPALMAHLRGLLPDGLDNARPFTALRHLFPEGVDRQTVVFVPGVRGEIQHPAICPFGLTVERHPSAWRVVGVHCKWMVPDWFLDADDELPSIEPL